MTDINRRAILNIGLAAGVAGLASDALAQSATRGDAPTEGGDQGNDDALGERAGEGCARWRSRRTADDVDREPRGSVVRREPALLDDDRETDHGEQCAGDSVDVGHLTPRS